MAITLTQLTSFLAVVRQGSITAAAEALIVTQPSVSAALAALNREMGVDLLERAGRSVRLSPAGEAFAPYAADVIGLLEEGRDAARQAASGGERRLRIVAVTTAAESFVPPLMKTFAEGRDLDLVLDVGNRAAVVEAVLDHRADVAIAGEPPTDERFEAVPLMPNEIVLVTAPDDPLALAESVTADMLADRTWLLREPSSGTRALNERFIAGAGLDPRTLTLGSNGAIRQAARAGLGISLIPRAAVEIELEAGWLAAVPLAQPPGTRRWWVLRSAVGPVRAVVTEFMEFAARELDPVPTS